jgi:hypothetical protein
LRGVHAPFRLVALMSGHDEETQIDDRFGDHADSACWRHFRCIC